MLEHEVLVRKRHPTGMRPHIPTSPLEHLESKWGQMHTYFLHTNQITIPKNELLCPNNGESKFQ